MAQQSFSAWQAVGAKQPLELSTVELYTELGADEVEVKVSHCGVCHTDTSLIDDEWAMSAFPAVCGHEVVGSVTARGANVTAVRLGERVACANQSGACLRCEQCVAGRENLCKKAEWLVSQGGFGAYVRLHASFVFALPPALASEHAAPLMCAGSTVYAPLRLHGVRPGERVAVVGVGGLGHLAVQFARAWGTHVTALSASPDKEADARRLGAHAFLCTANAPALLKTHTQHFDFMLVTAAAPLDWALYLALLRNGGTVCCVGVPGTALTIPSALDFVTRQLHLSGAGGCSRAHFRDMLDFAALHQIRPQVEVLPFARINDALDRVRKNQARYRVVLAHDVDK